MKKIFFIPILITLILSSQELIYAEKITILYTADTQASLYPCDCPNAPYGGVARRATLIKKLRQENSGLLLLDSGGFFAGSAYDVNKVNLDLDKKRTMINIKAMELMKYDAVAIGANELNFGKDFLEDTVRNTKINFLSCNAELKGVQPFIIKEIKGVKIGILAVMPQTKGLQYILNVTDSLASLKNTIKKLKDAKADLIILLSQLGEQEDGRLIREGLDADIVIVGLNPLKKDIFTQINSTILLRSSRQARYLRRLQFEFKNGKINKSTITVDELALSEDIADDPDISSILPKCFSDKDCRRPGLVGRCKNPATENSECVFSEYTNIPLLIIEPKVCYTCNTQKAISILKDLLPGIRPSYLKSDTKEAQELIRKFDIKMIPAYILDIDEARAKNTELVQLIKEGTVELKHDKYVVNSSFFGVSYFVGRKFIKDKIDMFIDLNDENSKAVLSTIKQLLEEMQGKIDFNLHFLAFEKSKGEFYTRGGLPLIEEYRRSVCIMEHYPDEWWNYILCRTNKLASSWWEDCIGNKNWDKELIKKCSQTDEGARLLKENIRLTEELKISYGPLLLFNNQEVFGITKETSVSELKGIINPKDEGVEVK